MIRASIVFTAALLLGACSAADNTDPTSTTSDVEELRAPACKTVNDCEKAFENKSWSISPARVDECVQNHDFPYICMACSASTHRCSFHPGF